MAMAGVVVPGFAPPPGPAPGFPPSSGSMGFGRGPPPHMGMMPPGPMGMPPGSMPMSSGPMGGPPMPMGSGPMGPRGMLPPHGMNAGIPPHMQPPGPARGPPRGPPGGFGGPPGAMPGPDMGSPPRGPPGPRTVNVFAQHPPPPPQDSMDDDGPPQDYEEQPEAGPYGGGMSSPMASPAGHQGFAPTYEDSYQEESYGQPPPMQYSPQRPGSRHIRPAGTWVAAPDSEGVPPGVFLQMLTTLSAPLPLMKRCETLAAPLAQFLLASLTLQLVAVVAAGEAKPRTHHTLKASVE